MKTQKILTAGRIETLNADIAKHIAEGWVLVIDSVKAHSLVMNGPNKGETWHDSRWTCVVEQTTPPRSMSGRKPVPQAGRSQNAD